MQAWGAHGIQMGSRIPVAAAGSAVGGAASAGSRHGTFVPLRKIIWGPRESCALTL